MSRLHRTVAAVFFSGAVALLVLGQLFEAGALVAGGLFMYFIGPRIEGEKAE